MASKFTLPDELDKKLDKAISKILDRCAEKMAYDCDEQFRKVMSDFYASYAPRTYKRTRETRFATNFRSKDYRKLITNKTKKSIEILYSIDSSYIQGSPYRADTSWVFQRTFGEGIHGWTPEEVADYTSGSNYGYYGSDGQFHVNRMMYWHDVSEPFSPSPLERMEAFKKQYKSSYNLRGILQPIAKQVLSEYFS